MNEAPVLELADVTVRFGGITACESVGFVVPDGRLVALIGPNGAGKTTVLNTISGIYSPQPGASILLRGPDSQRLSLIDEKPYRIARMGVARTLQNLGLFPSMTVLDNLLVSRYQHQRTRLIAGGLFLRRAVADEIAQREAVEDAIELLRLTDYRHERVQELPYGLQKRVELARAISMEPRLLLLDEPVAGMNAQEKAEMVRSIEQLRRELQLAILLVEHDMGVVMNIADHVVVLDFGRVIASDSPEAVQADDAVIAAYLGTESSRLDDLARAEGIS